MLYSFIDVATFFLRDYGKLHLQFLLQTAMKHKVWLTNETPHSLLRHKEAKSTKKNKVVWRQTKKRVIKE